MKCHLKNDISFELKVPNSKKTCKTPQKSKTCGFISAKYKPMKSIKILRLTFDAKIKMSEIPFLLIAFFLQKERFFPIFVALF